MNMALSHSDLSPAALCAAKDAEVITKELHSEARDMVRGRPKKFAVGHSGSDHHGSFAAGISIPDAASRCAPTISAPPCQEPFTTATRHHEAIEQVVYFHRLWTDMLRGKTKLILQGQSSLRRLFDGDKEKAADAWKAAVKDASHELRPFLHVYISTMEMFEAEQSHFEKEMVRAVKALPIFQWAKSVKGFGDAALGHIIGEASGYGKETGVFYSVGDFKSVSALWKRMGLAVLNGHRQGAPGKGATADDWIAEGYSKTRRSVMWNVGNSLILSMGKFRPLFGEDVRANPEYTELQCVFAERARYEAERLPHKCGAAIKESKTGKDSYTLHAANRAKRYTEKRLLRMLYSEWRRCMA